MNIINYNDIDFNKLKKLNVDSTESNIYIGKDENDKLKVFKIYKEELEAYNLTLKSEKLKILENKNMCKSIVVPYTKIVDKGLVGTVEDYIDGIELCSAKDYYDDEEILNILLNISRDLELIHKDKIIVSDLNFANIIIDNNMNHHFLDVLSYSIDRIPENCISTMLYEYLKRNRRKANASINNDKICFLLLSLGLLIDKYFYDITDYDLDEKIDKINKLENLREIFYDLRNNYVKDVPYMHQLIR